MTGTVMEIGMMNRYELFTGKIEREEFRKQKDDTQSIVSFRNVIKIFIPHNKSFYSDFHRGAGIIIKISN